MRSWLDSPLMSQVLVIEPDIMLRHALAVALFPDHQVRVRRRDAERRRLKDVDAMIVDAAMLRERERLSAQSFTPLQSWQSADVWIDDLEPGSAPDRVNWITTENASAARTACSKRCSIVLNPAAASTAAAEQVRSRTRHAGESPRQENQGSHCSPAATPTKCD